METEKSNSVFFGVIAAAGFLLLLVLYLVSGKSFYDFSTDQGQLIGTLLAGVGGFWGVIYSINRNAKLARDQHRAEQDDERSVVLEFLAAELAVIGAQLGHQRHMIEVTTASRGDFPKVVPHEFPINSHVYQTVTHRIGLLSPKQAEAIVWAYAQCFQLGNAGKLCNALEEQELEESGISGKAHDMYVKNLEAAIMRVDVARKTLTCGGQTSRISASNL